jgi:Secretion system C-terminal sorting domain
MKKTLLILALFIGTANTIFAQWQPTEGINGAYIRCTAVSGSNVFVGTDNGAFLSTDKGENWLPINNGLSDSYANRQSFPSVTALTVNGSKTYAATGDGVFVTSNNGASWSPTGGKVENDIINKIVFVDTKVFASTTFGVHASSDNGATFDKIVNNLPSSYGYSLSVNNGKIYVGTSSGLFVSTNDGATWSPVTNGLTGAISTDFITKGTTQYVGTYDDLFSSTDNGNTWTRARFYSPVYSLAANATHIYATSKNHVVYVSGDNGANWELKGSSINARDAYTLALVGTSILTGTPKGIFVSTDIGNNWRESNAGLKRNATFSFARTLNGVCYAGTRFGLHSSVDNGANWTKVNSTLGDDFISSMVGIGNQLFVAAGVTVYVSTDSGRTWTDTGRGLEPPFLNNTSVNSNFELATSGTNVFAANVNGVYLLNKTATAWTREISGIEGWRIRSLDISGTSIFASGYISRVVNNFPVSSYATFVSTNNGGSWRQIQTSTQQNSSVIKVGAKIFTSSYDGINVSDDNGNSWGEANNGIRTRNMGRLFANGNTIFASAIRDGIYYSTNNGANWRNASEGLQTKIIYRTSVIGNFLVVGTDIGVFRRPLSEFISVGTKDNKDGLSCVLSPNPVSNQLTINCSEALVGKKYAINNILGETMSSAVLNTNSTQVNVSDLANGIYFLQLIGTNKTIKFVKE